MIKLLSVAIVVALVLDNSLKALSADPPLVEKEPVTIPPVTPPSKLASAPKHPLWPGWQPCYPPSNTRCWTDWFDRDNPSGSGDWEILSHLRQENPGKICLRPSHIDVQTLSGLSVDETGDTIYKNDPKTGFICKNSQQGWKKKCQDYRVRFACYPPFCGVGVCWTKWFNKDTPRKTGDWELLKRHRKFGDICESPLYIEAVVSGRNTPAINTGEKFFVYNPTEGFACRKKDQRDRKCHDYKVRYGCPCEPNTGHDYDLRKS